jgi:hypothetical protein
LPASENQNAQLSPASTARNESPTQMDTVPVLSTRNIREAFNDSENEDEEYQPRIRPRRVTNRVAPVVIYAEHQKIKELLTKYAPIKRWQRYAETSTDLPQYAYCHLLGVQVPLKYLNCSHLFQKRWIRHVRDFGLSSINSEKNILILLKIFEEAFDAGRFVFLVDKQTGLIRCKIIDDDLKNKKLDEAMKDVFFNYRIGEIDFKGKIRFGDFDGQELHF